VGNEGELVANQAREYGLAHDDCRRGRVRLARVGRHEGREPRCVPDEPEDHQRNFQVQVLELQQGVADQPVAEHLDAEDAAEDSPVPDQPVHEDFERLEPGHQQRQRSGRRAKVRNSDLVRPDEETGQVVVEQGAAQVEAEGSCAAFD